MPFIRWGRVSLSFEHVPEMTSTIGTHNFYSFHAEGPVGMSCDGAGYCVEKGWPSAAGLELLICAIQGCTAGSASIGTFGWHVLVVFASEGRFSAFLSEDAELFWV